MFHRWQLPLGIISQTVPLGIIIQIMELSTCKELKKINLIKETLFHVASLALQVGVLHLSIEPMRRGIKLGVCRWKEGMFDELCQTRGPIYSSEGDMSKNICEQQYSPVLEPKTKSGQLWVSCACSGFSCQRGRDIYPHYGTVTYSDPIC